MCMWQSQVPGGTGCFGLVSGMYCPLLKRADRAAQFGEALEATDAGVAGIDAGFLDVVEHAVGVVGAGRTESRHASSRFAFSPTSTRITSIMFTSPPRWSASVKLRLLPA